MGTPPFFFSFGCTSGLGKFLGQRLNPSWSCDLPSQLRLSYLKAFEFRSLCVDMCFLMVERKVGGKLSLHSYWIGDFSIPSTPGQPLGWKPCCVSTCISQATWKLASMQLLGSISVKTLDVAVSVGELCKVGQFLESRVTVSSRKGCVGSKHQ